MPFKSEFKCEFKCGIKWVLRACTLSLHFVSTLCRIRFVLTLCPYALSKAREGHMERCLGLVLPRRCWRRVAGCRKGTAQFLEDAAAGLVEEAIGVLAVVAVWQGKPGP